MRALLRLALIGLVALPVSLSSQGSIPTPASVFGFEPGADYKLATYDQVISYFQKVDAASDLVTMVAAGKSTQGRTFHFALISSRENLRNVERYRQIAQRLAHPEGLTDDEARKLAREGKAFVHIDGGLHSSEVAGPQHAPLLLYNMLTKANQPEMKLILDNVIFMLWPTINPDGMQMVNEWYMARVDPKNLTANVPGLPHLYQEYVGHDNNRDAYMLNMIESRVMEHAWRTWEPNIIYVQHQSSPFPTRIWLPPFAAPIATHAPFIPSRQVNMIGMAIAQGLDDRGKTGATHMGTGYDAWYPGYIDYLPIFKNIPAFWTETQGNGAAPRTTIPDQIPANMRIPQPLYPSPWLGGTWRLRDAVEYNEIASLSVLEYAAKYRESLLYGRYQSGRDQIRKGRSEAPYAYTLYRTQRDSIAAVELLRRLAFAGVRVYEVIEQFSGATSSESGAIDFRAQSYLPGMLVIPLDQEFSALARELLDRQEYPDVRETPGGVLDQPYDAAGWTLPLQMGVEVFTSRRPLPPDAFAKMRPLGGRLEINAKPTPYNMAASSDPAPFDSVPGIGFDSSPAAAAILPPPGRITGEGRRLSLDPAQTNSFRALNYAWKNKYPVEFAAGKYLIDGMPVAEQETLIKTLALQAQRTNGAGAALRKPRIALLSAPNSMDNGWTRWVLERFDFEFTLVPAADIATGGLRDKFDVLLLHDDARIGAAPGRGGRAGGAPAGASSPTNPPAPAAPPDQAVAALDDFVRNGGTVVAFNRAGTALIDQLKLPVRNALTGLTRQQFFVGGSILGVTVDASKSVMWGMPDAGAVFFDAGPAFETLPEFKGSVLARYESAGSPLMSGYLLGEKYLQDKAAALDVELGSGRVILLGFRPQWRGQSFGTFRVIFNALTGAR